MTIILDRPFIVCLGATLVLLYIHVIEVLKIFLMYSFFSELSHSLCGIRVKPHSRKPLFVWTPLLWSFVRTSLERISQCSEPAANFRDASNLEWCFTQIWLRLNTHFLGHSGYTQELFYCDWNHVAMTMVNVKRTFCNLNKVKWNTKTFVRYYYISVFLRK